MTSSLSKVLDKTLAQTSEIQVTADFMKDLEESEIENTPILTTLQPVTLPISLPSIPPPPQRQEASVRGHFRHRS